MLMSRGWRLAAGGWRLAEAGPGCQCPLQEPRKPHTHRPVVGLRLIICELSSYAPSHKPAKNTKTKNKSKSAILARPHPRCEVSVLSPHSGLVVEYEAEAG